MQRDVLYALLAAALFGASTPLAKLLGGDTPAVLQAGLLYLGSGVGLMGFRLLRDRGWTRTGLTRTDVPWLLGAIAFGGIAGPVALMQGLQSTSGSAASLLLNLEAVLTAGLAWWVFRENAGGRIVLGMVCIVAGAIVLSWPTEGLHGLHWHGPLLVALACLCWAIDNNLTRKVAASDALFIAASKGLVAGGVNTLLALVLGAHWPVTGVLLSTLVLGLLGYGISLVLFVLALRGLGTARTGAYFSIAPFLGAVVALVALGEPLSLPLVGAGVLMGLGVWLHLTEQHVHTHTHEVLEHTHPHVHDAHHQHTHDASWNGQEPHVHAHRHQAIRHTHPHYPDIHHRHSH